MQEAIFHRVSLVIVELWPFDFAKMCFRVDFRKLNSLDLHCNVAKYCLSDFSFSFNLIQLQLGICESVVVDVLDILFAMSVWSL